MATTKTRHAGFSTTAVETADDQWEFTIGGNHWRFRVTDRGINLYINLDGIWRPVVHVNTLVDAGMFAEGFNAGFVDGFTTGKRFAFGGRALRHNPVKDRAKRVARLDTAKT